MYGTLQQAFLGDEVDRLLLENHSMFALTSSNRPSYGAVPDPEVTMSLDESDVNGAITELAAARGISTTDLAEQVFVLSGGEHDTQARAQAVVELAAMDEDELAEVGLAAKGKKVKNNLDDDEDEDDEDPDDEDIRESEHMGYEGPKPKPGKRRTRPVQVRRRGQTPFGGEGGSPDGGSGASGTGDGGSMAATGRRMLVRAGYGYETVALSEDEEWAEAEIARLTQEHPTVGLGNSQGGPGVAHVGKHFDFDIYDTGTVADDATRPSDDLLAEVQRYVWLHKSMSKPKAYGANTPGKLAGKYPGTGPSGKPQTTAA
jgi:hypothetical protein